MGRIFVAAEQLRNLKVQSGMALGIIAFQNLVTHQARKPSGRTLAAIPVDHTTRQEMFLDAQRDAVETRTTKNEDRLDRKLECKKMNLGKR